jgi:hypothetical protein
MPRLQHLFAVLVTSLVIASPCYAGGGGGWHGGGGGWHGGGWGWHGGCCWHGNTVVLGFGGYGYGYGYGPYAPYPYAYPYAPYPYAYAPYVYPPYGYPYAANYAPAPAVAAAPAPPPLAGAAPPAAAAAPPPPASPASSAVAQNVWYFCPSSKSFYPYVGHCAVSWRTVPTQPPGTQPQYAAAGRAPPY